MEKVMMNLEKELGELKSNVDNAHKRIHKNNRVERN